MSLRAGSLAARMVAVSTMMVVTTWCYCCVLAVDIGPVCPLQTNRAFPSVNGECRHLEGEFASLGGQNRPVNRLTGHAAYADGTDTPIDRDLPSARVVSNALMSDADDTPLSVNHGSLFFIYFGQFIDHDITLVEVHNTTEDLANRFDIKVAPDDAVFGKSGSIPFGRSKFDRDENGVRQFRNVQTPWLDLSQVYGATSEVSHTLRAHDGSGKLKTRYIGDNEILELNSKLHVELEHDSRQSFACGDARCNEHPVLLSLTTLFAREHNRLATEHKLLDPAGSDETIFHRARLDNIHAYQQIIYEEWLPKLLGQGNMDKFMGKYKGYYPHIDPATNELFRLAAFRWGHSGIVNSIAISDAEDRIVHDVIPNTDAHGHVRVSKVFFRPDIMFSTRGSMLDLCLNGVQRQVHNKIDVRIADVLRNELFEEVADRQPFDLPSLNMQRARDHGLPLFDEERAALNLRPLRCGSSVECVTEFTGDADIAKKFIDVYGNFDRVDAFVAGLAEKIFGDGQLGETWTVVIADQFRRMRDGDRFHYAGSGRQRVRVRMHDILNRNLLAGRRAFNAFEAQNVVQLAAATSSTSSNSFEIPAPPAFGL